MEKILGMDRSGIQAKLHQFDAIIGREVAQRCGEIDAELEAYRAKELEQEEDNVLQDSYRLIQREVAEIEAETTKTVSRSRVQMKQRLYAKREEYCSALFSEARKELETFAASENYRSFLLEKVQAIGAAYGCDGFELLVRESDLSLESELNRAFGVACAVRASEQVQLGGVIARHPQKGYVIDETLDFILESQKEWFHRQSELVVGL